MDGARGSLGVWLGEERKARGATGEFSIRDFYIEAGTPAWILYMR